MRNDLLDTFDCDWDGRDVLERFADSKSAACCALYLNDGFEQLMWLFSVVPLGAFVVLLSFLCWRCWFCVTSLTSLSFDRLLSSLGFGFSVLCFDLILELCFLRVPLEYDCPWLEVSAFLTALASFKQSLRIFSCFFMFSYGFALNHVN